MIAQTKNNWKRNAVLFLISQCITLFGSMIVQMSIIWYVTLKNSSERGWLAFIVSSYLPQFLILFLGGVWADRYSHKKLIIFSDTVIMLATFIMFLVIPMMSSDVILLSGLLGISIIRSIGAGVQTPAVNADNTVSCSRGISDEVQWNKCNNAVYCPVCVPWLSQVLYYQQEHSAQHF